MAGGTDNPPQASAQQAGQACEKETATQYFDLVITVQEWSPEGKAYKPWVTEASVAGTDFRFTSVRGGEYTWHGVYKDGVGYRRNNDEPWRVDEYTQGRFFADYGLQLTEEGLSICPDLSRAEKLSEEMLDGVSTTRYASSGDLVLPSGGGDSHTLRIEWDYWMDETGQLVQIEAYTYAPVEDGNDDSEGTGVVKIVGVGEPNVITAPEVVCSHMYNLDNYKYTATITTERNGVPEEVDVTLKAIVSGDDYYAFLHVSNGQAAEFKRVDGTDYERESQDGMTWPAWELARGELREPHALLTDLGETPMCPSTDNLELLGEEELDGRMTTKYASGDTDGAERAAIDALDDTFRGLKQAHYHEYWLDETGQLVQHRHEVYTLSAHPESTQRSHNVVLTRFYHVGDRNGITAPTLGE